MSKLINILLLRNIHGIGPARIITQFSGPLQSCPPSEMLEIIRRAGFEEDSCALECAKREADTIQESGISWTAFTDVNYPSCFSSLAQKKPPLIFYTGDLSILSSTCLGVVGTREPSSEVLSFARSTLKSVLAERNCTIVSGLAIGSDTLAHKCALEEKKKTAAILPGGLRKIVPKQNSELAEQIVASGGCLVSEYEPWMAPTSFTFVQRDRLIAAASNPLLVFECKEKSGTMHTIEAAAEYGKTILCYDNSPNRFSGNDYALRHSGAIPFIDYHDILLGMDAPSRKQLSLF